MQEKENTSLSKDFRQQKFLKEDLNCCSECEGIHFYIHEGQGFIDICCIDCRIARRYLIKEE